MLSSPRLSVAKVYDEQDATVDRRIVDRRTKKGVEAMKTKLITTVHWAVPEEFKKHVEESNGLYFLVFGGGSKRLEELNDSWLKERCVPDDTNEDNISNLNPYLNEMTSIYTVWKNQGLLPPDTEAIGHAHYRRFFTQ